MILLLNLEHSTVGFLLDYGFRFNLIAINATWQPPKY